MLRFVRPLSTRCSHLARLPVLNHGNGWRTSLSAFLHTKGPSLSSSPAAVKHYHCYTVITQHYRIITATTSVLPDSSGYTFNLIHVLYRMLTFERSLSCRPYPRHTAWNATYDKILKSISTDISLMPVEILRASYVRMLSINIPVAGR